ncbi:MFS transporter [Halobacillus shinanisalinarum]|uniref:MFS transporter n=1 Tax=Halobacillus shinanisalinarum TaxID=2932258 RepID=A0ABY4H2R3_9BACI|nr:MFS transporter [Halobacillus shinanisalinarum]UOQ94752.1 MFS transporter [Halobacillus shinanisalinarum]
MRRIHTLLFINMASRIFYYPKRVELACNGVCSSYSLGRCCYRSVIRGKFSDLIYIRTGSRRIARAYWSAAWFGVLAICLIFVVTVKSSVGAVILLTLASFALASAASPLGAVVAETVPDQAGSIGGFSQLAQTLPGIFAPIITGFIVDATNSFDNAFYLTSLIVASGVVIVGVFLRPPERTTKEEIDSTAKVTIH